MALYVSGWRARAVAAAVALAAAPFVNAYDALSPAAHGCNATCAPETQEEDHTGILDEVHVAYLCDARNFLPLLNSMASLARTLSNPDQCSIHLIVPREDMSKVPAIIECFKRELAALKALPSFRIYPLRTTRIINRRAGDLVRKSLIFERFYLQEYLPADLPRVVFLDADTIIKSDIRPLYRRKMTSALAAVRGGLPVRTIFKLYVRDWHMFRYFRDPEMRYVCQAVSVLDLTRWRSGEVTRALESWAERFPDAMSELEILNLEFQNGTDDLDWRWHVWNLGCSKRLSPKCRKRARILHWSGPYKPWIRSAAGGLGPNHYIYQAYAAKARCGALA